MGIGSSLFASFVVRIHSVAGRGKGVVVGQNDEVVYPLFRCRDFGKILVIKLSVLDTVYTRAQSCCWEEGREFAGLAGDDTGELPMCSFFS